MKKQRPCAFLPCRVKKFLLYGALFLALLSPLPASGQDLNAVVEAGRWWAPYGYPENFQYQINNNDDIPIAVLSLTLNVRPGWEWFWAPPGWNIYIIQGDTVVFAAISGSEVPAYSSLCCFWSWAQSYNNAPIDYQLVGIWPGTDQGRATWGKTYGHSAY